MPMRWRPALRAKLSLASVVALGVPLAVGAMVPGFPVAAIMVAVGSVGASLCLVLRRSWQLLCMVYLVALLTVSSGFNSPGGLPLAFLGLVALLATLPKDARPAQEGAMVLTAWVMAILGLWGMARLIWDIPEYGAFLALRDGLWIPDIMAAFVGYALYRKLGDKSESWLAFLAVAPVLYACLYPLRLTLQGSQLTGAAEPLIGFAGLTLVLPLSLFWLLTRPGRRLHLLLLGLCTLELVFLQSRTLYLILLPALAVVTLGAVRAGIGKRVAVRASSVGLILLVLLLASPYLPEVHGRVGRLSVDTVALQLDTLSGGLGPGAGGVEQRRAWTGSVFHDLRQRPLGLFLGAGLGRDFLQGFTSARGVPVRKPHNDYVEVLGRMGLLGLVPWALLLIVVLATTYRAAKVVPIAPAVLGFQVVTLFTAATQPVFAFEYGGVPFWLFWGLVIAACRAGGSSERRSSGEDEEHPGAAPERLQTRAPAVAVGPLAPPWDTRQAVDRVGAPTN
jgi:hypothetical protein